MNLHEYQAKALFKQYGMPVPNGFVASSAEDARLAAEKLSTDKFVVKVQVHAGGRCKAGGVKLVDTPREAADYAKRMLGTRLITSQTDSTGLPINSVLVEESCTIDNQLYLGMVIDRASEHVDIVTSTEGGMEFYQLASDSPEIIQKTLLDPVAGILPCQCQEIGASLGLSDAQINQFEKLLTGLGKLFVDKELAQVVINPLAITLDGDLVCLDGKISIDDNVLSRHEDLQLLRDTSQEDGE